MWYPFWYNLPCFHPKGNYNHRCELNIVDGSIGLTVKLLLLHMHVIVNMKKFFEHIILGNMSWFFGKTSKPQTKVIHTCAQNHMQLYVLLWMRLHDSTFKVFCKNAWLYTFNWGSTFYFLLNTFFYNSFFNINVAPIQNFHCKLIYISFLATIVQDFNYYQSNSPTFQPRMLFLSSDCFQCLGTLVKKSKKYVNINIGCNILVVG
jgi:hypothetical protein